MTNSMKNKKGLCQKTGKVLVVADPRYFRPAEVEFLWGDPSLAHQEMGWQAKTTLPELVRLMVQYDDYGGTE